jgi:hypothetical protein
MTAPNTQIQDIRPRAIDGFVLPIVDLAVTDHSRRTIGKETLAAFISSNEAINESTAKSNARAVAGGEKPKTFTPILPDYDVEDLLDRLGGRDAALWWAERADTCTLCVRGNAEFALVRGQEYWPLVRIPDPEPDLWALTLYIAEPETAAIILRVHLGRDEQTSLGSHLVTCWLPAKRERPFTSGECEGRLGSTIYTAVDGAPFSGARAVVHYSPNARVGSTHVVVADGDLVWAAAQCLSALELQGDAEPTVVIGLAATENESWSSMPDAALSDPEAFEYSEYTKVVLGCSRV